MMNVNRNLVFLTISAVILFSCQDEVDHLEFSTESFTMELPSNWTFNEVQGYDSHVRQIKSSDNQIIDMDLGWYSSDLPVDDQTHDITFKLIDNKEAKIVQPRDFRNGTTGVYFGNLDDQGTKLQMSGIDLSESNQLLFLNAIETIKFK